MTRGYGYQQWRAVLPLLSVVAAAVILAVTVGGWADQLALIRRTRPLSAIVMWA